ncbi:hypothetical protein J6590_032071 [Homalodisca vitripennis]|nr:hypothetical protein J6590_032071 [Homalodisca vitripennis]
MSHSNEMARSNSLKWDIKTHKSSDEEYDSDETCCDYNGTTAIQIAIQHLENDLENKNNKHVSNGTKSQSPLSDSTKALIQSNASDETFAQVVYLNDSLQDKFNTQTSNSERISYFGFTDMDSTVEWYEKNVENRSETTKEHDHDKEQDLFEKPESNILLTAPLDLQNCKNIPQNEVIYSENDPHCIYSGKTALECNNDNLYNVNISGTENSHTFDLFGHHEGNLPSVTTALNQMNFSEGELNLGLSHTTSLLVCCDKNDKFINLSGKELDEQINMCDVENCKDNLGITDNTLGSCTQTVCQPMSAENASFSNSNECIKGLTETLLHIFENNNNFNNFMKYNDTPLPRSSVCTPPYSLNKPTKIIKTPTQKVLPKLKQKKKNSSQKTKILPLRRCVSTYTKHLRRSNESVNITEIEESTDKTNKNLKPESEQYGVAKKQKRQRKQKTKHETNETIDEHQKSMVLPNDFKKKVNANKDIVKKDISSITRIPPEKGTILKDLEEIEEGRATLGNRMHRWLRGLEHMTREEAFQMHSEVQCYIKKIEAIATKQRKKRGAKKTDTGVDRKKFEMYLKCLNDWSRIIDNAIADFDNIIIEQQKSAA